MSIGVEPAMKRSTALVTSWHISCNRIVSGLPSEAYYASVASFDRDTLAFSAPA